MPTSYKSTSKRNAEFDENWEPTYSAEQRKEFWKHDLNPITGHPAPKQIYDSEPLQSYAPPKVPTF